MTMPAGACAGFLERALELGAISDSTADQMTDRIACIDDCEGRGKE